MDGRALPVVLYLLVGLTLAVTLKWGLGKRSIGRTQVTLTQAFVFFTIFAMLGWVYLLWFVNDYLVFVAR